MPVFETFAKRQKRLRGDVPDVFAYDTIPDTLRVQIVQILHEVLGDEQACVDRYGNSTAVVTAYKAIVTVLRRELGVFRLPHSESHYRDKSFLAELCEYVLKTPDIENLLSAIELCCRIIENDASSYKYRQRQDADQRAKEAIEEINARFKEHGVGYEYDGEIIKIDTELVHAEAVKPALSLLRDPTYKGAEDEFLQAYAHYRKGNNKEAMNDALKAFESTMKSIFDKRKWAYSKTDPAAKLIKVCFDNGLIPAFWESHFAGLRSTLEAGVPTGRNKLSGHGQGQSPTVVPDYLASYILHMTASAIVFLVNAEKALP